jgi:hypothetical protein
MVLSGLGILRQVSETKDARPFAFVLLCRVEAIGLAFIDELETKKKKKKKTRPASIFGLNYTSAIHSKASAAVASCATLATL